MSDEAPTTTDRWIRNLRNKRIVAVAAVLVLLLGGVTTILEGVEGVSQLFDLIGIGGGCDLNQVNISDGGIENCSLG